MTVTAASPKGGRPVLASTTCAPRCAAPDVATAPVRTGTTATSLLGSCGSSIPMRHGGAAGSRVRQVMSPPADRQKSVSGSAASAAAARSAAQPLTTPDGSRTPPRRTEKAPPESRSAAAPSAMTSRTWTATSGRRSATVVSPRPSREITESAR